MMADIQLSFAEKYILLAYNMFHENAERMEEANRILGGISRSKADASGRLHTKFSDRTLTAAEREQVISLIGESWDSMQAFMREMEAAGVGEES